MAETSTSSGPEITRAVLALAVFMLTHQAFPCLDEDAL